MLKRIDAALEGEHDPDTQAALYRLMARVDTRASALEEAARATQSLANAPSTRPRRRQAWLLTHKMLALRARLLATPDAQVLAEYPRLAVPWDQVRSEGQLALQIEAMAAYAEAAEHVGERAQARAAWQAIADLKYPRIKGMDLSVKAQARLAADQ